MKKALEIIAGVLITVVILYFSFLALGKIDFRTIKSLSINWVFVGLAVAAFVGSNYAKGAMYSFGIAKGMPLFDAVRFNSVGNAVNMVLPLKFGEGFKLSLFPKEYSVVARGKLFGLSMALDCVSIIFFAVLSILFSTFKKDVIGYNLDLKSLVILSSVIIGILGVGGVGIGMLFKNTRKQIIELAKDHVWTALSFNLLSWGLLYLSKVFSLLALIGMFPPTQSIKLALLVTVTTNIAIIIPSTPGALGLFEFAVVIALMQSPNVNIAEATAAGIVIHVIQYIGLVPMGLYYYFKGLRKKYA